MDAPTARFTERISLIIESDGFPRIAGRIFGLLLLRDAPCSLDQLAKDLGVSKASVSTNARLLATHGVLERVARPADRRDYYRITPDLFSRMMAQRMARWQHFTEAVGEGRRTLPRPSSAVRRRLAEYEAAYAYMTDAIGSALARWPSPRRRARTGAGR